MIMVVNRKYGLDVLKIICTVLIILHHFQQAFSDVSGFFCGGKFYFGYICELFFMISGYLSIRHIEDTKFSILRLMITAIKAPVLMSMGLYLYYFLFEEQIVRYMWNPGFIGIDAIIRSILGIDVLFDNIVDPSWYISDLVICYIILIILAKCCKRFSIGINRILPFVILLFIVGYYNNTDYGLYNNMISKVVMRGGESFFIGLLLAVNEEKISRFFWGGARKACAFIAIIGSILYLSGEIFNYQIMVLIYYPAIVITMSSQRMDRLFKIDVLENISKTLIDTFLLNWPLLICFIIVERFFTTNYAILNNWYYALLFIVFNFIVGYVYNNIKSKIYGKLSI